MRNPGYKRYLDSPQWKAKREAWFAAFGRTCRACGSNLPGVRHLHHLSYEHFGREPLSDLVAVCVKCHQGLEQLHYKMGKRVHRKVVFQTFKAANLKGR